VCLLFQIMLLYFIMAHLPSLHERTCIRSSGIPDLPGSCALQGLGDIFCLRARPNFSQDSPLFPWSLSSSVGCAVHQKVYIHINPPLTWYCLLLRARPNVFQGSPLFLRVCFFLCWLR
jgi:hypothetical protein